MKLATILLIGQIASALQAVPVLLASHKLVPDIKVDIQSPNTKTQVSQDVTHMIKRLATECSSDVYLLVNAPGLTNSDMIVSKKNNWPHVQKYLHMASSVVGLPWMEGALDLDHLSEYFARTCKADMVMVYSSEDEVEDYIDTRKRVIRVEAGTIPTQQPARDEAVRQLDDLIRKILRKVPSPHYTILITSSQLLSLHPIPQVALDNSPELFEIFHDIVNDPSRQNAVERNNYLYQNMEPTWQEHDDATEIYLARRRKEEVHFFDADLWKKKEKVVMTLFLIVSTFLVFEVVSFGLWLKRKATTKDKKI